MGTWATTDTGVLQLPSGRRVRGRGLRHGNPDLVPEFGLYLLGRDPGPMGWPARWVRWPDFWLPTDRSAFRDALDVAWQQAAGKRVEIACAGGKGRTGTALACLAILDGVPPREAVDYVRARYDAKAVETPWQRRFVRHFRP